MSVGMSCTGFVTLVLASMPPMQRTDQQPWTHPPQADIQSQLKRLDEYEWGGFSDERTKGLKAQQDATNEARDEHLYQEERAAGMVPQKTLPQAQQNDLNEDRALENRQRLAGYGNDGVLGPRAQDALTNEVLPEDARLLNQVQQPLVNDSRISSFLQREGVRADRADYHAQVTTSSESNAVSNQIRLEQEADTRGLEEEAAAGRNVVD
ncbi:hypothetical protein Pan216_08850 [Planctomycetes bacterium Pan216]|uniref:Uncharacterized protein n=1 Tax=Kolteria novifilia TaxID=2527975 RepID=A0A518AZ82_9BACT|nr:hypothetical protein Pan216_08850 [Planctomycetes bacterium Pan216]